MAKRYFFKIATDPDVDSVKCIVGVACAAQAVEDGHDVDVFFAAAGVRFLDPETFNSMSEKSNGMIESMMDKLLSGSRLHCSFGSVAAVLGKAEGDGALVIKDDQISWSGPPEVIAISEVADVTMVY
ncbi:MAG: hypothetical protein CMB67_02630 [Euryarchaeota archaeon]|nr:hypothetical protein [Euryarchaeota archaeon]